tara:strand:- start:574 stop:681 length:108 start_codon:yes stop_codon:yes gene_type:complete
MSALAFFSDKKGKILRGTISSLENFLSRYSLNLAP